MEEINIKVTSVEVKGSARKIRFKWTPEPIEDAPVWVTPEIEAELTIEWLKRMIAELMHNMILRHGYIA